MKEEKIKKFELNMKMLENFEEIMSTKLDEIEELKITGLDKGSKLLNIISLCANVKNLIVEGDQRLNADKILTNVFKPESLENLVFINVKLPTVESLKRYTGLKRITLKEIRFGNIKNFLDGIVNPENIETVHMTAVDMGDNSLAILEKFTNLQYVRLEDLKNAKLTDFKFLNHKKLLKVEILENRVPVKEINALLDAKCMKNIEVGILDPKGKPMENCELKLVENASEITTSVEGLYSLSKQVDLYKIKRANVRMKEISEDSAYIELLKIFENVHILLEDFSCLKAEQARKMKEILKLGKIEFVNKNVATQMSIGEYIAIRQEIEEVIQEMVGLTNHTEKFLKIYQKLGEEFTICEKKADIKSKTGTVFQMCQFFENCLKCVGIHSNIILGENLEERKKHYWNQVELEGKWYNVDLAMDMENIKKHKPEYCLLGDKDFFENHTPKSGKNNYCAEDFNPKLIQVFFKTGLLKENLLVSYLQVIIDKIRKLFHMNKTQEVLALPEATQEEDEPKKK